MAKRHLTLLLTTPKPQKKLDLNPRLYLSKKEQPYFDMIGRLGVSEKSSNHNYFFWNHYFSSMTRYGRRLAIDHISILSAKQPIRQLSAHDFWNIETEVMPKPNYYTQPIYRLQHQGEDSWLSIFFLTPALLRYLINNLEKIGSLSTTLEHDENTRQRRPYRKFYRSHTSFFCKFPSKNVDQVQHFMDQTHIIEATSSPLQIHARSTDEPRQAGYLDLDIVWNKRQLASFSFNYYSLREQVINALQQQLQLVPVQSTQNAEYLIYSHDISQLTCSVFKAIEGIKHFLADFITVLHAYAAENLRYTELKSLGKQELNQGTNLGR